MPPARSRADGDPKEYTTATSRHTNAMGASSGAAKRSRQNNGVNAAGTSRDRDRDRGVGSASTNNAAGESANGVGRDMIGAPGIDWPSAPPHLLHAYRHAYSLPLPSAFRSSLSAAVLTSPASIGRHSPTMVGRRRGAGGAARSSPPITNGVDSTGDPALPSEQTGSTTQTNGNTVTSAAATTASGTRRPRALMRPAKTSKEALALAVRRHFNSLAVSEADVVVEFLYRVKFGKRSLRWRFGGGSGGVGVGRESSGGLGAGSGRALG